jgi:hypothetical protein
LQWLRIMRERGVCPELNVLGVIANRTARLQALIKRESNLWRELQDKCRVAWGADVYFFERFIPTKPQFAEAAEKRRPAALDDQVRPFLRDLIAELQRRSVVHASRRPAAIRA